MTINTEKNEMELRAVALMELAADSRSAARRPRRSIPCDDLTYIYANSEKQGACVVFKHKSPRSLKYGSLRYQGKVWTPHRLVAHLLWGEANGRIVMHLCDNPGCVNPEHLEYSSQKVNVSDTFTKVRARPGGKPQLTEAQVRRIVDLDSLGNSRTSIAKGMGISWARVTNVLTGKTYSFWTGIGV